MNTLHPSELFLPPDKSSDGFFRRLMRRLYAVVFELHPATSGCGTCRNRMLSLDTRACHDVQPTFPVDVVYTWVDGSDPLHLAKRAHYLPKNADPRGNALHQARFRDNEELRFSLRALEQYAPWVRKVIIATDNQRPAWLNCEHPKIRIVDHTEFIPERFLPTFNSHVIESYLHNIPELSEHYIYLNDDVFLARPCRKTDFFTPNGLPMAFVDWRVRRIFGYHHTKTPHAMSYFNTVDILHDRGINTDTKFITAHGPYAQTRRNTADAFAFYQDTIEGFAVNKFRTTHELALYSHALPLWIYLQKRLVPSDERYYYVQTTRVDRLAYYMAILHSRNDHVPPLFFCINDVETGVQRSNRWREDLRTLLLSCCPNPSSFELAAHPLPDVPRFP